MTRGDLFGALPEPHKGTLATDQCPLHWPSRGPVGRFQYRRQDSIPDGVVRRGLVYRRNDGLPGGRLWPVCFHGRRNRWQPRILVDGLFAKTERISPVCTTELFEIRGLAHLVDRRAEGRRTVSGTYSNQIESNQIESNQIKSNQIISN